jgi:two-component system, NarL family, sensor kinase
VTQVAQPARPHLVLADARGSRLSRHQRDWTTWRLVVGSLVALGLMVVFGLVVGARLAERQALVDARRFTEMLADTFVDPEMARSLIEHDEAARDSLDVIVRDHLVGDTEVRRIKVWSTGGEVLYSNDGSEIGRFHPLSDHKMTALTTNTAVEEVSDLSDTESRGERPFGSQLIEVYDPVPSADGGRVLFEAYLSYERVLEQREAVLRTLIGLAVVGFVALAAVQLAIGLMNVRWLRRRQRHVDEHVRASAERDRRLLARNLHDGPVQDLVGTAYVVEGARSAIRDGDVEKADGLLGAASASLRESVQGLRAGIVELHPRSIHQVGFAQAVDDLAQPLRTRGVTVTVDLLPSPELDRDLDAEMVEVAHLCVKELLRNILRHADAAHVDVTIERGAESLSIRVRDDGRGMDTASPGSEQGHLGLEALADIATEHRGALELWSAPGAGTDVRVELAL